MPFAQATKTAFTELLRALFDRVYNFAFARLRHRADAEEVAQETLPGGVPVDRRVRRPLGAALVDLRHRQEHDQQPATRSRAQELRIERAEEVLVRNAHSFDACSPEDHASYRRSADAALKSLASVSAWQAEVFALRHFENMPIQEIADRMSRSNDAIPLQPVSGQATDRRGMWAPNSPVLTDGRPRSFVV
jgi:DNA-directed RNA polymerase specialized sigma24 family protein